MVWAHPTLYRYLCAFARAQLISVSVGKSGFSQRTSFMHLVDACPLVGIQQPRSSQSILTHFTCVWIVLLEGAKGKDVQRNLEIHALATIMP